MGIQAPRYDVSVPEAPRVMAWQDEVAKSIAHATSSEPQRASAQTAPAASAPSQVIFNQIITTSAPPVVVTRVRAEEPKPSDEIGTRTFVGTVLGAAAGGIIMYAMTKSVEQSNKQPEPQRITTYRTIEAPPAQNYAPPSRAPEFNANSKGGHVVNGRSSSRAIPIEAPSCSHSETVISRSEYSCHSQNGENEVVVLSKGSRISAAEARHSHVSHAPSSQKTIRQADLVPLPPSAPVTKVRSARNVPLPYSVATSRASRDKDIGREVRMEDSRSTVVTPHDSISQVSTKPSKASGRAKHHREEDEHRSSKGEQSWQQEGFFE